MVSFSPTGNFYFLLPWMPPKPLPSNHKPAKQEPEGPDHVRIYVTRGQFNKLDKKHRELHERGFVT